MKDSVFKLGKKISFYGEYGHSFGGISPYKSMSVDKIKVKSISKIPTSKMLKDKYFFRGHASFFRRLINDFNNIAGLLSHFLVQYVSLKGHRDVKQHATHRKRRSSP